MVAVGLARMVVRVCIKLVSVSHMLKCAHLSQNNYTLCKSKTKFGLIVVSQSIDPEIIALENEVGWHLGAGSPYFPCYHIGLCFGSNNRTVPIYCLWLYYPKHNCKQKQ